MNISKIFIALSLVVFTAQLGATEDRFNSFIEGCQGYLSTKMVKKNRANESSLVGIGYCLGLIDGVREGMEFFDGSSKKPLTCFPSPQPSNKKLVQIVMAYFISNPEEIEKYKKSNIVGLHDLIRKSIFNSYPCK